MRFGYMLLGLALGAGYSLYRQGMIGAEPMGASQGTAPAMPKPQRVQSDDDAAQVEGIIGDVVHRPDIPETPVKQAFEAALGEHPHTVT